MDRSELSERLWKLVAEVGRVVDALPDTRLGNHVATQLVRCSTAAPPLYDESARSDMASVVARKLGSACKRLQETHGWLRLIERIKLLPEDFEIEPGGLVRDCEQLLDALGRELLSAKGRAGGGIEAEEFEEMPVPQVGPWRGLDHLAIAVPDTEEALKIWRDRFGFPVLYSEVVNQGTVRLTHLDLGNTHLQLVEPLTADHPLQAWLREHGPGLHHFCLRVEDVGDAMETLPPHGLPTAPAPHQGTQGKRALFLDKSATQGVQVELTGR